MKIDLSKLFIEKVTMLLVSQIRCMNLYIPDRDIERLVSLIKNKVLWTIRYNLKYVILDYINKNHYCFTELGNMLYDAVEDSPSGLKIEVNISSSDTWMFKVDHSIRLNTKLKVINPNERANLEEILNITCYNRLEELFFEDLDYIIRKAISDLNIEVNEDIDEYENYN